MTKTKSQLRAEAVERLRKIRNARYPICNSDIGAAIANGNIDNAIDLLTDDDALPPESDVTDDVDGSNDSREKLEEELFRIVRNILDDGAMCEADPTGNYSRKPKWEPDESIVNAWVKVLIPRLDRQAAITERELCDTCEWPSLAAMPDLEQQQRIAEQDRSIVEYAEKVAELEAELDTKQGALNGVTLRDLFGIWKDTSDELEPSSNQLEPDTRKKLEADIEEICWGKNDDRYISQKCYLSSAGIEVDEGNVMANHEGHVLMTVIMHLLDRQAAITTQECNDVYGSGCEACRRAQKREVFELHAKVDELEADATRVEFDVPHYGWHEGDEATLAKVERQLEEYGYVKVTRCLDCRNRAGENEQGVDPYFCVFHRMHVQPNFFCAWGESMEEGEADA